MHTLKMLCCIVFGTSLLFVSCKNPLPLPLTEQAYNDQIRLNQIGYYPESSKKAVVVDTSGYTYFHIVDINKSEVIFTGKLSEPQQWDLAGEKVRIADFSEVTETGTYYILIDDIGYSYPFEIKPNVLRDALVGSVKGLYYQRAGMALEEQYAGQWKRAAGHPDDAVLYHPSSGRTAGIRSSPKGWYDAGDYNKYVVNGSFPLGQLLLVHDQYPNTFKDGDLDIPESGNKRNDYLDELRYEMDWLLTMQDDDGGLFFKLTAKKFEGYVLPKDAESPRYIVGKSTAASLDFAAVAAQAYRIYKNEDVDYAKKCLAAGKKAYQWAVENPTRVFKNPEDIRTGEYGDNDFSQEWLWANAELYLATQDTAYLEMLVKENWSFSYKTGDGWASFMRFSAAFSLLEHEDTIPENLYKNLRNGILKLSDELAITTKTNDYFQPISDFQWGSNSDVLNASLVLAQAYRLEPKAEYLQSVQYAVDYIFGKNAVGYSYLTGFGDRTPMHIHHRQSASDTVDEPVPGLLSGGPNNGKQDAASGVVYPENASPMKSWTDHVDSYASNEICLNWNAPLTYVLAFLEAESK